MRWEGMTCKNNQQYLYYYRTHKFRVAEINSGIPNANKRTLRGWRWEGSDVLS